MSDGIGRRDLLILGGALAAAPLLPGAAHAAPPADPPAAATGTSDVAHFEFDEATIASLQAGMKSGRYSAADLARAYLARADAIDAGGPRLRAILTRNPDAIAVAESLDRERKAKGPRGPLHGIPILVKDNIDTADKMATTAGSLALEGSIAPRDAFVVARLRAAGAVLLGKTNLSEWANIRSSFSSSGWSALGGQTRNPYALDRSPCGSSSGSAVAVAANLCVVAVGTETSGSVVCPASVCNLVGIKPTVGVASRAGVIPISSTQDTTGPLARTVTDAAILLGALAGPDPRDPATRDARLPPHRDYTRFLDAGGLRGARIGVARKLFGASEQGDKLVDAAIDDLRRAGAILVDPAEIEGIEKLSESVLELLLFELKATLDAYLADRKAPVRSLADVIAFNEKNAARELRYFGQDLFKKAQAKGPLDGADYQKLRDTLRRAARTDGIDATLDKHKIDALVAPTLGPPGPIDLAIGDHFVGGTIVDVAAAAGYPHITVPAGFVLGLPVGLSFIGRAFSEPKLIGFAFAYEQATHHRRGPGFLKTIEV